MPHTLRQSRRLAVILALALLPVGAVAAISTAKEPADGQLCEIKATPQAGMVKLEALAKGDTGAGGTYSFHVEKSGGSGSSVISQGGDFNAAAGRSQLLSSVTLDAKAARYKAVLDLVIDGRSFSCTKQIGGD
ncbi:curli-like amyloid fiber formation chaperone CsgH [Agrobacterium sp. SOY23]|uniref:curli-like amyloid fiber formation chaperone CsgH n=1 Tax=Agrobacterium sp. SOY23 TaxID=3014555 RepID=UPI0022B04DDA|nr:curli-like amyloid fiber formation chaperone CsgH [Agrobacterium sp. SOY23]MCZ4431762.1 curli-like amyloid fiber formation chaperone CsgH [Agrobacterium sp. SOY23]